MADIVSRSFSSKLRELTSERGLNQALRANASVSGPALREFRQALDNIRLIAWTVSELQNARQTNRDARAVISFLTAERLRRFSQMVGDLYADLEHDGEGWSAQASIIYVNPSTSYESVWVYCPTIAPNVRETGSDLKSFD